MIISCIACESRHLTCLGPLPVFTTDFLGQPLNAGVTPGSLYQCHNCTLSFRAPAPTEEELRRYYSGLPGQDWWQYEAEREVWRYIKQSLETVPEKSVLDVGCFRGDLLNYLGSGWQRYGVEPSVDARKMAEARGVQIIGESIETLQDEQQRFGAITLIDVIEHLPRPLEALQKLLKLLEPGGRLVIFTGTTDAPSWRFAKTHYWYSAMPEHVAFFRPTWFRWAASPLHCRVTSVRRLPYQPAPLRTRLDEGLKNVAYISYQRLAAWPAFSAVLSRLPVIQRIGVWKGCWWTSARDHILVVLTKNDEAENLAAQGL